MNPIKALIFDVDGTLSETEEAHRASFNEAFAKFGLDWHWDQDLYRVLLKVTGGKERIRHRATELGITSDALTTEKIAEIHAFKTERYARLVEAGECQLRPGVETLLRGASDRGLRLAIATTTSHANVDALLAATLAPEGKGLFEVIAAGDDVPRKKPAPDVYLRALGQLDLPADHCVAIEDSANGVASARAAGLEVWVTPGIYTLDESFDEAAHVLVDLSQIDRLLSRRLRPTQEASMAGNPALNS